MKYQIVYSKHTPLRAWAANEEQARKLAGQLRQAGYSVDVWERTSTGIRKTDI